MKPFKQCPVCMAQLKQYRYTDNWIAEYCAMDCKSEFRQNFLNGSKDVSYIYINIKNFGLYVYYETGYYPDKTYVYSNIELVKKGVAGPIMILPYNTIDFLQLEKLAEKLSTLALFI